MDAWAAEYENCIGERMGLLARMLEIARGQEGQIQGDDAQGLKESMEEREELLVEIQELDRRCLLLHRQIQALPAETRQRVEEGEARIHDLLLRLQQEDQANGRRIREKLRDYQGQLRRLRQARQGVEGYGRAFTSEDGVFIDVKK